MIVKYSVKDGKILYIVNNDDNLSLYKEDVVGEDAFITEDRYPLSEVIEDNYVENNSLKPRPFLSIEENNGVLYGVPSDSVIKIDDSTYHVNTASPITLDFPYPGKYVIHIIPPFPYRPAEVIYENNPQT